MICSMITFLISTNALIHGGLSSIEPGQILKAITEALGTGKAGTIHLESDVQK